MTTDLINHQLQNLFKCKLCGNCCRNENSVAVTHDDIKKIAKFLNLSYKKARIRYFRIENGEKFIIKSKPCIFFDDESKKCKIYDVRPVICKGFPYLTFRHKIPEFGIPAIESCPGSIETSKKFIEMVNH